MEVGTDRKWSGREADTWREEQLNRYRVKYSGRGQMGRGTKMK